MSRTAEADNAWKAALLYHRSELRVVISELRSRAKTDRLERDETLGEILEEIADDVEQRLALTTPDEVAVAGKLAN